MADTLEIIRRQHEAIVREEQGRRRTEPEVKGLLPLLRAQVRHWREAGGAEAGCALAPLIEAYEGRLRGEVAEGPTPGSSPVEQRAETVQTPFPPAADPVVESEPEPREEPASGRGRGRRRVEE